MSVLSGYRVCLISSGHLGSNPRLVKEADALHDAGAEVHVISLNTTTLASVQARDAAISVQARWSSQRVSTLGRLQRILRGLLRRAARLLFGWGISLPMVVHTAFDPRIGKLTKASCRVKADIYIAHNLAALPAAYEAARTHGAKLGFDAEDFHSGEYSLDGKHTLAIRYTEWIERHYIPRCDHVTAASPGIARAYARLCAIRQPVVVLNVFPLNQAPLAATASSGRSQRPALYWFSQTIGTGRGLEVVIRAIAAAHCKPTLYLQGVLAAGYREELDSLLASLGLQGRVHLLPPVLPDELVPLAAGYDAGIASEMADDSPNRAVALSNKLFTYLLAGIPVLASDTPGQAEFAAACGDAVQLYPQRDSAALARLMDAMLEDPQYLRHLREQAWRLGQQRYHWEKEQAPLVQSVARVLQVSDRSMQ